MKYWYSIILLSIPSFVRATDLVTASLTGPLSFVEPITTQSYDRAAGVWYIGSATGAGNFTIAKAKRTFNLDPTFSPIGSSLSFVDKFIEFLTIAAQRGEPATILIIVPLNTGLFTQTQVFAINTTGSTEEVSEEINDAASSVTEGIVAIAAKQDFVFTAVRPSLGDFGDSNSGIALVNINTSTLALNTLDATTGNFGNKAQELTAASTVLKGDSGGNDVVFQTGNNTNRVALYWDDQLQRLYTGVRITTGMLGTDIAKSVVVSRLTSVNALALEPIAPDSAIDTAQNQIVVTQGMDVDITAKDISVLHASTGPSYLIVNGGRASSDLVGNRIRALPLVDNPSDDSVHGTLANKNADLQNCVFVTPATAPGELLQEDEPAAIVGAGNLPLMPDQTIAQILTLGDTVYVAIATPQSTTEESGLFYSEALFNEEGKIIHWTPWTKRCFPFEGFPEQPPGIQFFTVDAFTSKVWSINGEANSTDDSNKIARVTAWERETTGSTLIGALNQTNIQYGSCSALDLDQSTNGFACNTPYRYALFGAPESVVFTLISQAFDPNDIFSSQQVTQNFSLPENLLEAKLKPLSGSVSVLEYSRRATSDNTNYFFAGTEKGLFVFTTPAGNGFNATDLSTLDLPPFSNGRWQKIETITGSITDIKTTGNALYVLTFTTSQAAPLKNTLYRIPFASNFDTMFDPTNLFVIAETATGSLSATQFFSEVQIISTSDDATQEQLILATNNGLYQSTRPGGVQDATDQSDVGWTQIETGNKLFFNGIAAPDNASIQLITCTGPTGPTGSIAPPSTAWPFNLSDPTNCKTFDRSDINQVNGSNNTEPFALKPQDFNSIETENQNFSSLYPVTFFWTDGGRRICIVNRPQDKDTNNKLLSLPFDTIEWNINSANQPIINDSLFDNFNSFNWIKLIGVTGELLAGTNKGVIALK